MMKRLSLPVPLLIAALVVILVAPLAATADGAAPAASPQGERAAQGEPAARSDHAPRSEPAARSDPAPRSEPAARSDPAPQGEGHAQSTRQKLYVLSSAGSDVTVIDVASNQIIGSIEVGDRPHGLAAPASQDILYVATEFDSGLSVVDPVKDVVVKRYHGIFGKRPNEIDVTSDGRTVYLPLYGEGVYEVFDTVEEKVVARIPTDGLPHNAVVSPDDRFMYLSPMDRGRATAEQMEGRGLPSTENNKVYIADTRTHEIVGTIPTGDAPRPIAVNPDGKSLYVNTDGLDGFLVLDLERREKVARVEYELTPEERAAPSRSHGLAVTPDGREVWSADVNRGLVFVFDATQSPPKQIAKLENAGDPYWMTVTPDGATVYVSSAPNDTVTAFDVATKTRKAVIQLGEGKAPKRLLVLSVPGGQRQ